MEDSICGGKEGKRHGGQDEDGRLQGPLKLLLRKEKKQDVGSEMKRNHKARIILTKASHRMTNASMRRLKGDRN